MDIASAIKQKSFRNEKAKAIVNILYTHSWLIYQIKSLLAPYDITVQQYNILRIINGSPKGIGIKEIRKRMLDRSSDVSRLVERLIAKKLVKKIPYESDLRHTYVVLSDEGNKIIGDLIAINIDIESILVQISESEAEQLNDILDKIRSAFDFDKT
ncbi:MAG: MarR family winged helix-turn-helix transcriptional regulator [Chitinophagales bacterium]|nr:winged helix-turn-helix transcriptional regulator [Bacteroidota bacterium]MCB9043747.1 winged helix-turn-helix transcriptional regulator [Chitinophagales bacterium]